MCSLVVFVQVIFETPGGTVGRSSLPLQQEMFYPGPHQAAPYDDYDDYRHAPTSHRPSRIDSAGAGDGVYRGEIQLDSMSRPGRPRGAYGEQETRFM